MPSSSTPRITDIRLIGPAPTFDSPPPALSIGALGVFFDGGPVWVDYPFAADGPSNRPVTLSLAEAIIRHSVAPALRDLPLAQFKPLAALLDALTHDVTITRPPASSAQPLVSRRNLLTGRVGPLAPPPQPIVTTRRQVIPATVRYAVSLALLKAVAQAQHCLPAHLLAAEYSLSRPQQWPGLLALFDPPATAGNVEAAHRHQPAAFGWALAATDGPAKLGAQAETVQTRLRTASDFLRASTPRTYQPGLVLNAHGRLGALCDDSVGKVLGMLYGMQYVTAPYPFVVCDPAIKENLSTQIDWLKELKSYLRFRKVELTLAAEAHIRSVEAVHALADAGAAGAVWLDTPQLGSLHQTMSLAQAAKQRGLRVFPAGVPSPPLAHTIRLGWQVALAVNGDYLVVPAESPSALALAQTAAARLQTEIDR